LSSRDDALTVFGPYGSDARAARKHSSSRLAGSVACACRLRPADRLRSARSKDQRSTEGEVVFVDADGVARHGGPAFITIMHFPER
jgi:hypothetical protein